MSRPDPGAGELTLARVLAACAAVKAWGWLVAGAPGSGDPPRLILAVLILAFSVAAIPLVLGGRRDPRATHLGAAFLAVASPFAQWTAVSGIGSGAAVLIGNLRIDAFLPYLLWTFFAAFPRVPTFPRTRKVLRWLRLTLLGMGVALGMASILIPFRVGRELVPGLLETLADPRAGGPYWGLIAVASLPAPLYGVWTSRWAPPAERRRTRLLMAALLVGLGPALLYLIVNRIPPISEILASDLAVAIVRAVAYPSLLALPAMTAYAVLVQHALDVRLVVRRAVRYILARYTLLALIATPVVASAALLWVGRQRTLAELFGGTEGLLLLGVLGLAVVALAVREPLLDKIDRRFFRETHDRHAVLKGLVESCRRAKTTGALGGVLEGEIERAFHPERLAVLILDREREALISTSGHPGELPIRSVLVRRLTRSGDTVSIDLEDPRMFESLPVPEQHWLIDSGAALLVRLRDSEENLIGLIALGKRRSDTPYTREDRALLGAIASAASASLENHLIRKLVAQAPRSPSPGLGSKSSAAEPEHARECADCGRVHGASETVCSRCGGSLSRTLIPLTLAGRYRMESRIGAGGMGVVYRARDQRLNREVAIKTLPRMEPGKAARLRREARALEVVTHPHLARLKGVETWRGLPFLVFEHLSGGTLEDRLRRGPMHPDAVLELGLTLTQVVGVIHRVRILHRDIKPSNIGFNDTGTMKLLDFGLARVADAIEGVTGGLYIHSLGSGTITEAGPVGTIHYLSPEALWGAEPDPSFDLWSIAVVLFEALTGRKPVDGPTIPAIVLRIVEGDLLTLDRAMPDPPRRLQDFFSDCFSLDRSRRPATAGELRERLRILRMRLNSAAA